MRNREIKLKPLAASILSLSLLTVMAGAAVAPALEVIRRHFSDASQLEVQLVVCMPALFIVITNMFFGRLASRFGARTLTMVGLALYTVGGAAAGLFNSIWAVLVMRALVGVGVGMIMPLSTGLLTYYFAPEKREGLMGLSSAANQLGGVVATLLAGVLANISWRLSFLVYLMGLISIVLCLIFMPNDRIRSVESSGAEKGGSGGALAQELGLYPVHVPAHDRVLHLPGKLRHRDRRRGRDTHEPVRGDHGRNRPRRVRRRSGVRVGKARKRQMRAPCRAAAVPDRLLPARLRRRLGRNDRRLGSRRLCQRRRRAVYHLVGFGKRGQGRRDYGHAAHFRVAVSVAVFKSVHPLARVGPGLGSGEASVLPRSRRERGVFAVYALRTGQNNE